MKHAPLTPIPSPTLPLKGRESCSSPFKGEAGRGMGNVFQVKRSQRDAVQKFWHAPYSAASCADQGRGCAGGLRWYPLLRPDQGGYA
ncbi:MAG: hypothetical protein Q8O31_08615 [Rhodocyclaceae bacterium]|nr:hypothetical protein [Rhodocyclaceae bacterium]